MARKQRLALAALTLAFAWTPARAVDGVIEVNQARAIAGGVTPADTPGFPVTIDVSGSYRLTSNLDVDESTNAIEVTANARDVSIDLNGFAIQGPVQCSFPPASLCSPAGTGYGISGQGDKLHVANGAIRGMGSRGISTGFNVYLWAHAITVSQNGLLGILAGGAAVITDSIADRNGNDGIAVYSGSVVRGCTSSYNGEYGINAPYSTVVNNSAVGNKNNGIAAGGGSTVMGNTTSSNGGNGIQAAAGSTVIDNVANSNASYGINFVGPGGYAGNTLTSNGAGQVGGGTNAIQTGLNVCGTSTTCP